MTMLLTISELRTRIEGTMDQLVSDLQAVTHRYTYEEAQSWRNSLPKILSVFGDKVSQDIDVLFTGKGDVVLEYQLPALPAWVDMILLGEHNHQRVAVFIELKDWVTKGDLPGPSEGLMTRHGQ